ELPNGIERLADLEPGGGPVQAVVAAFRRFPTSSLLVLACDLPRLSEAAVRLLARPLDAEIDARLPRVEGCPQPLAALYGPGCATVLEASLATGERSMVRSLARLRVEWLEIDAQHHPELACALQDFDTPEDLAGLR
ncbi:MAG: NTP transferase domain-containing protein, partial [Armatimonadetes bacterium]|nr:NTP transferase domain-containing protein [Armatimonadota bacterium]